MRKAGWCKMQVAIEVMVVGTLKLRGSRDQVGDTRHTCPSLPALQLCLSSISYDNRFYEL